MKSNERTFIESNEKTCIATRVLCRQNIHVSYIALNYLGAKAGVRVLAIIITSTNLLQLNVV